MKIHFLNGSLTGKCVEFALSEITIGRDDCNILRLVSEGVSRYHARLCYSEERGWVIVDQNSTNGVRVNGSRISGEQVVFDGDELTIGEQKLSLSELSVAPSKVIFNPVMSLSTPAMERKDAEAAFGTSIGRTAVLPQPETERQTPPISIEQPKEKEPESGKDKEKASGKEKSKDNAAAKLLDELSSRRSLFGGSSPKPAEENTEVPQKQEKKKKKGLSRLSLYTLVGFFILIAFFAANNNPSAAKGNASGGSSVLKNPPLELYYEKIELSGDNAFRFTMSLQGDKVTFVLDDIRSKRHPDPIILENVGGLQVLRQKVLSSGIFKMKLPPAPAPDEPLRRRLVISAPPELIDVSVGGAYVPLEFETIEKAIDVFAESQGLQTIILAENTIFQLAEDSFSSAEDLFANRESNPEALRDAIARYRVAVNYLEPVRPRPPMWNKARHRLDEALQLRKQRIQQLNFEINRLKQLNDVEGLRNVFRQIMELCEEDSREWNFAKQQLLIVDRILRQEKKR